MGKLYSKCWKPPVKGGIKGQDFNMSNCRPHLDTGQWLNNLELKEYVQLFKNYDGVEDLLGISERELKDLGIKNGSHRARIMSSLVVLRDKYNRGNRMKRVASQSVRNSPRHSRTSLNLQNSPSFCPVQRSNSSPSYTWRKLSTSRNSLGSSGRSSVRSSMEPVAGTEASTEELKKALEWELSLDNSDLRSHAWYHGTIPRQRAEELMSEEGDFLIRDCISRPGDYVLTCLWKGTPLHFVINKVVFQPFTVYERIQYQFEDDCFDTVPDLVTYYVGNKRPISAASGAVISRPVNRSMPLTYYASRYGLECQMHYAALALEKTTVTRQDSGGGSPAKSDGSLDDLCTRRLSQPPEIPQKMTESGALSAESLPSEKNVAPRNLTHTSIVPGFATIRPHPHQGGTCRAARIGSDPMISPTLERRVWESRPSSGSIGFDTRDGEAAEDRPPPKPSRVPSKRYNNINHPQPIAKPAPPSNEGTLIHLYSEPVYPNDKEVRNGGIADDKPVDPDSSKEKEASSYPQDERTGSQDGSLSGGESESGKLLTPPDLDPPSTFNLPAFTTLLLPAENKPLDSTALAKIRCLLLECGSRILASHLTKTDLDLMRINGDHDFGLGVATGFELLLLPQGRQLRLDLLERTECLKYFVAVTILTCGEEKTRAELLNKWIQISIETKTALGNLYGFAGIMQGLSLPQITRLRSTWLTLRQTYTDNAFTYETKLRPTLKAMQECSNPQAPNTCIPYLLSLITILQRHLEMVNHKDEQNEDDMETVLDSNKTKGKVVSLGLQWEQTAADYGLQLLLTHLEIGRSIMQQWPTYRRNSEIVLENVKYDELSLDMFRTDFHLRFLWGNKGANVIAKERYSKFEQVLSVMSERCEGS